MLQAVVKENDNEANMVSVERLEIRVFEINWERQVGQSLQDLKENLEQGSCITQFSFHLMCGEQSLWRVKCKLNAGRRSVFSVPLILNLLLKTTVFHATRLWKMVLRLLLSLFPGNLPVCGVFLCHLLGHFAPQF